MNKQLHALAQKEMMRKEFLTMLGLGAATLMGFSSILKLLNGENPIVHHQPKQAMHDNSSSPYGT